MIGPETVSGTVLLEFRSAWGTNGRFEPEPSIHVLHLLAAGARTRCRETKFRPQRGDRPSRISNNFRPVGAFV